MPSQVNFITFGFEHDTTQHSEIIRSAAAAQEVGESKKTNPALRHQLHPSWKEAIFLIIQESYMVGLEPLGGLFVFLLCPVYVHTH